jgi:hypothetical protein
VDLLSQLGLSLLDGGHDHVADTTGGETVETGTDTLDGDDVQVTGSGVVGAVHDGTAIEHVSPPILSLRKLEGWDRNVHRETEGHLELATRGTTPLIHCQQPLKPQKHPDSILSSARVMQIKATS